MLIAVILLIPILMCFSQNSSESTTRPPLRNLPLPVRQEIPAKLETSNFIVRIDLNNKPICIGTILNKDVIITSALCLADHWPMKRNYINVAVGPSVVKAEFDEKTRRIARHVPDPRYIVMNVKRFAIALEILEDELLLGNLNADAITVYGSPKIQNGGICQVFGIGIKREEGNPDANYDLKQTFVKVYNFQWCNFIYDINVHSFQICSCRPTSYVTKAAFDVGSALVCERYLVGITSLYFQNPTKTQPEVFKSVVTFWNFIKSVPEASQLKHSYVSGVADVDKKFTSLLIMLVLILIFS